MAGQISRVVVSWSGVNVVGLASTVLHFLSDSSFTAPDVAGLRTAFFNARSAFPVSTSIQVPGSGDVIDPADGTLLAGWSATTPAVVNGSSTDTSAAGVGACVNWATAGIVNGHRVRGRSFLVPLSTFAYDQNGTITSAQMTALQGFGAAVMALPPQPVVWHRPTTSGGTDGSRHNATSYSVRDRVAYLSSRRS